MARDILLYQDYVHSNAAVWFALCEIYGQERIRQVTAHDIATGVLHAGVTAFVMPGGATRYVNAQLGKDGNTQIKTFVEKGGTYIGICAGAYYACARTEWDTGSQKIFIDNDLLFCKCVAKGPIRACVNKETGFHACITHVSYQGSVIKTLYWGGPEFFFINYPSDVEVLATYTDVPGQPAAALTGSCGEGRYILFSSHFELDTAQLELMRLNVIDNRMEEIAALQDINDVKSEVFFDILKRFVP